MLELIGHIGSTFLILCGLPQLYRTIVTKDVDSLSPVSLIFWSFGCIMIGIYVFMTTAQGPLLINYGFNAVISGTTAALYFLYKKRN